MYNPTGVKTSSKLPVPAHMKAWVLGGPDELFLREKPTPVPWRAEALFHAKMELHHSLEACMAAVPALLLAALGTVWLVFSSRRATLNQINLSLAEISEQLRRMRQPAPPPDGA